MMDATTTEVIVTSGAGGSAADCAEFGALLGLNGPVAPEVFAKAVYDPEYARNLIMCRETPVFRDFLLDQARGWTPPADDVATHGSLELAAKAAQSFWAWTKSGFTLLDETAYAERFNTCLACPNLMTPPDRLIYRIAGAGADADRRRICGLCGCVASRKARLPHERCPDPDPQRPGLNRWGQTLSA